MVAQLRQSAAVAATALRAVPAMSSAGGQGPPKIDNTICCTNDTCKLPLLEIYRDPATKKRRFRLLHATPERPHEYSLLAGEIHAVLHCPGCGASREVTLR